MRLIWAIRIWPPMFVFVSLTLSLSKLRSWMHRSVLPITLFLYAVSVPQTSVIYFQSCLFVCIQSGSFCFSFEFDSHNVSLCSYIEYALVCSVLLQKEILPMDVLYLPFAKTTRTSGVYGPHFDRPIGLLVYFIAISACYVNYYMYRCFWR